MGGAKAEQMLDTFLECSKNLDRKSQLQISSDGPNVNLKFFDLTKTNAILKNCQR